MNTDLELYRVFCEVVKYKNISKTAESMYVSQSAITQSIQKLESLLGGKVFYRNKNGVELTEEGKNLYEYIKDSIETMNNAENVFSKYITLEKGKIRIGGGNSLLASLIFEPFLKFTKKYPNLDISISSGITDILMQKLANGELDIVALNLPFKDKKYSNIEIIPLKKSTFCFFASKDYIKKNPIKNFKELKNNTLILPKAPSSKKKILDDFCKKENIELVANYEVSSTSIMKRLVLNDIGIGFTNIENLKDIEDKITIINKIEIEDTKEGIATLKKNMSNKATIELVKEIKQYYKRN
mgnify:CR=1 FL=1